MKKRKLSQADVQRAIGVHQGVVTRWLRGIKNPDLRNVVALERTYGIPVEAWLEEADAGI